MLITLALPASVNPVAKTIGGMNAHATPKKDCRYCPLMSRTINRQASSREAHRSQCISRSNLRGCLSLLSGVYTTSDHVPPRRSALVESVSMGVGQVLPRNAPHGGCGAVALVTLMKSVPAIGI